MAHTSADDSDEYTIVPADPSQFDFEYFEAQALQKFPEEYARILKKHGAVEYVKSDDRTTLEGLEEPEEYLRLHDRQSIRRFQDNGTHALEDVMLPITSSGLIELTLGQLSRAIAEWEQLKTDPEYLYERVVFRARTAGELFPDPTGRISYTMQQLLTTPRYVGMQVRYTIHNALLEVAHWSEILDYLREVEQLDATFGRYGARGERGMIMSQVKKLMDHFQRISFKAFYRVLALHPAIKPGICALKYHPDFGGIQAQISDEFYPELPEIANERGTLRGALIRLYLDAGDEYLREEGLFEVSKAMREASAAEKEDLDDDMLNAWGDLEMLKDFILILGTDGEDWRNAPQSERFVRSATRENAIKGIFEDARIDKYTSSAESLRSEGNFKKIWAELEAHSRKKAKKNIENLVTFTRPAPIWSHDPELLPEEAHVTPDVQTPRPALPKRKSGSKKKKPKKKQSNNKNKPLTLEQAAQPADEEDEEEAQSADEGQLPTSSERDEAVEEPKEEKTIEERTPELLPTPVSVVKVKSRGATRPSPPLSQAGPSTQKVRIPEKPVRIKWDREIVGVYKVGKQVYEVLERLLVQNFSTLDWHTFEKIFQAMRFAKRPKAGSVIVFYPPTIAKSTPFVVHR